MSRHGPREDATILFIDNEPFESLVFTAALEGRYLEVRRVPNAAEALRLAEDPALAPHIDLVIFAHRATGISDSDFISELHTRLCSVPVLVLGAEQDGVEDYPATEGLVVFLARPVTVMRVITSVREILARSFCSIV